MSETTPPPDAAQQQSELQLLRKHLLRIHPDISAEQLWIEMSVWLRGTADSSHHGSLESHVRGELAELTSRDQHKMFPHVDVDDPEDAFPDRCQGCEHYGVACPIIADHTGKQQLKRTYDTATSDEDLASKLFEIANQHNCHVLQGVVRDRREGIKSQTAKGHELYRRAMQHVKDDWDAEFETLSADVFDALDANPREFGFDPHDFDDVDAETAADTAPESATRRKPESGPESASEARAPTSSEDGGVSAPEPSEAAFQTTPPAGVRDTVEAVSATVDASDDDEEGGE